MDAASGLVRYTLEKSRGGGRKPQCRMTLEQSLAVGSDFLETETLVTKGRHIDRFELKFATVDLVLRFESPLYLLGKNTPQKPWNGVEPILYGKCL